MKRIRGRLGARSRFGYKNEGINGSAAMVVTKNSVTYEGVPVQEITGMSEGFELTLKANAKLSSGAKGYVQIDFKPLDQKKLGEEKLYFDISDIGCTSGEYCERSLPLLCRTAFSGFSNTQKSYPFILL